MAEKRTQDPPLYPLLTKTPELGNLPPLYSTMAELDDVFGEAYACIEQGLCYDDDGHRSAALGMYDRGLTLLREGEQLEGAKTNELYQHLKEAERSVEFRMNVLQKEGATAVPPKQEEIKSSIRDKLDSVGDAEAELIFCIPDGVQLFSIDDKSTTAPTYPTQLSIFKFPPREPIPASSSSSPPSFSEIRPDAFIQVGPWTYPLYKGQTPVLRNEFGAYVVSNPTVENPDMSVAILLPSDVDEALKTQLHSLLQEYAVLRDSTVTEGEGALNAEEKRRVSERLARFLIASGEKVAWAVQKTSAKGASLVHQKSQKYRNGPQTDKPMYISPTLKTGVVYLHKGSKVVAKCTRYLLERIGDVGVAVGRRVATGAKNTFGEGKSGGVVSGTFTVLGGGIASVSTVWIALEDASKTLCRSIADNTVEVVKVKYGEDAAETTHHSLYAAGHGSLAAAQLWDLGPRSIAGRMARKAGIQVVRDMDGSKKYVVADEKKIPLEGNGKKKQ